jgi:hypothetical protein
MTTSHVKTGSGESQEWIVDPENPMVIHQSTTIDVVVEGGAIVAAEGAYRANAVGGNPQT